MRSNKNELFIEEYKRPNHKINKKEEDKLHID